MTEATQPSSPAFPRGWFRLLLSRELGRRRPVTVRVFGRELVAFRDGDGVARVVDAYCPHLGAHLGGGRVVDGHLECPFHGWCFDGDGRCARAPFARRTPGARVAAWTVREQDDVVFGWHGDGAPDLPLPPAIEDGWTAPLVYRESFRVRYDDLKENIVDVAHFPQTHAPVWRRFVAPPRVLERRLEPTRFVFAVESELTLFGIPSTTRIRFELFGPGIDEVRISAPVTALLRFVSTPIDGDTVDFVALCYARRSTLPLGWRLVRRMLQLSTMRETRQDARIWAQKRYVERPLLSDADGPIPVMRKYLAQFYGRATETRGPIASSTSLARNRSPSSV
jgi:nitrite reductase/ring-hydroxylating ferredoxin subunit